MKQLFTLLLLLVGTVVSLQAQRTISGQVTEGDGTPLIGATILVKGSDSGTVTDIDGNYTLTVPDGFTEMIVSYTGFTPKDVPIGSQSVLNIILSEGVTLETAVVTALGIERERKALAYSVEEVSGDALTQNRETNLVNAIGGRVSGVQTTASGGQAGSSARIIIRGNSSFLGNNQPLFVIDGVPVDNSQVFGGGQNNSNGTGNGDSPLFFGGTTNRVVDIDPNNIESMNILKGAAATALYGSRAANGVVLITTKSGKRGATKPTIRFSTNYGFSEARLPDLNTTYAQGRNGLYQNGMVAGQRTSGSWGPRIDTLRVDADGNVDPNGSPIQTYDNAGDFFQQGTNLDNSLSIAGGNESSDYFMSYSNRLEEGIVRNNDMDRHSILAKFNSNLTEKLRIGASITYTNTDITTVTEGNGRQSYMWTVYAAPRTFNLQGDNPQDYTNPDGTQRLYRTNRNNPYFLVDNNRLTSAVNRFLPNFNLSYEIAPGLKLTNRFGADLYTDRRLYREVIGTIGTFPTGRIYEDNINSREFNNDVVLSYTKQVNDISMDFLIGNQINDRGSDRIFTQGVNLAVPEFFDITNAATITATQNNTQRRLIGAYASATFGYKSFLYLTMTGRNDWSSTLPKESRSYFYPSVASSFILTDAIKSLQNNPVLSFLKVRASYAEVGNDAPVYATQTDLYTQSSVGDGQRGNIIFPFSGVNGFTISNVIGNPDLKPERTSEVEFGLEAYLFNSRIHIEGSYYDRTTRDQIFQAPVTASSGAVSRIVNAGSMQNEGVEVLLEFTPVDTRNFKWDIGGTFTKNVNRVLELTDGVENIRLGGFTNPGIYIVRDQGYGVIWGSQYTRDDQGRVIIDDDPNSATYGLGASVTPNLNAIGQTLPNWFAGLRSTITVGNDRMGHISAFGLLDIRQGGDILNLDNFYLNFYGATAQTEQRDGTTGFVVPNSVLPDGSPNNIEVPYDEFYWRNNFGRAMEDLVEDGSFVRLREVTVAYAFPSSMLAKTFIQGLNVSITGRNLYLNAPNFTGADPESSLYGSANGQGFYNFITPGTIGYNFALNVTF